MAAHRYWRLQNHSASSGQIGIGEIQMASSPGGPDLCEGGTASASGTYGGSYSPSSAFDNNAASNWFTGSGNVYNGAWIAYDFGVGVEHDIVEVRTGPGIEDNNGMPRIFDVQWSDDGVTWNWAWTCFNTAWVATDTVTFTKPVEQGANRYWGFLCADTQNGGGDLVLSEVELRDTVGGTDLTGSGTPTMWPINTEFGTAANAFDDNTSTIVYSGTSDRGVILFYDFGANTTVGEFAVTSSNTGGGNNQRCISAGWLLYSQDGKAWTRCGEIVAAPWGDRETQAFATGFSGGGATTRRRMIVVT